MMSQRAALLTRTVSVSMTISCTVGLSHRPYLPFPFMTSQSLQIN